MRYPFLPSLFFISVSAALLAGSAAAQSTPAQDSGQQPNAASTPASATDKPKDAQPATPPKKVYTNDDLRGMQKDDLSVVGKPDPKKKPATGTNTAAKNDEREQASWHNRAQKLRDQLADVNRQIAEITSGTPQSQSTDSSPATNSGTNPIYLRGQGARLDNLRRRKADLEKQLDDLQEEARKAGVPPGWLR